MDNKPQRVFLDTNLLIRFLTDDDPQKAQRVERLLQRASEGNVRLVTAEMVIAEIVWVLESFYKVDRRSVRSMVEAILATPGLDVLNADIVAKAIFYYDSFHTDFADAYIVAVMEKHKIEGIYSFDKKHLERFGTIQRLEP